MTNPKIPESMSLQEQARQWRKAMSELSPAARAVFTAAWEELDYVSKRHVAWCVAGALRAVAAFGEEVQIRAASGMTEFDLVVRLSHIHAIATELENADD